MGKEKLKTMIREGGVRRMEVRVHGDAGEKGLGDRSLGIGIRRRDVDEEGLEVKKMIWDVWEVERECG